ncbi:MAG TPA: phosphoribosylformylglycinamidine synthase I [Planctomycetia bacterium]|nr:phosphoribosylformylglycinamidine synthase I [Planctomycetia bacterium]
MAKVKALLARAPGTNCDGETKFAFEQVGADVEVVHLNELLAQPQKLHAAQVFCIPGGFSYGDDIGAGRIFAAKLRVHLADELKRFRDAGNLILGICNGFQVLLQTGLLVEPDGDAPAASLTLNRQGRFEDRWVTLQLNPGPCAFVREAATVELPVAHGEGNFVLRDPAVLERLKGAGRITCQYVDPEKNGAAEYPANPNGSTGGVAGVCDATGRVFALMPHPERHFEAHHHPRWTRRAAQPEHGDGRLFFANAVSYFA